MADHSDAPPRTPLTLDHLVEDGRTVITIDEAAEALSLKRTATYEAVRRGQLPSVRLGRRIFVPVPALLRLLNGESLDRDSPGRRTGLIE
jgi:excisionase family DNA binding protein